MKNRPSLLPLPQAAGNSDELSHNKAEEVEAVTVVVAEESTKTPPIAVNSKLVIVGVAVAIKSR